MVLPSVMPRRVGPLAHQDQRVVDRTRQIEVRWLQLHVPRLDLREVEDVVDQGQEMPARLQDILQIFRLLVVDVAEHLLGEHFREADDGVERRAELVAHAGEELGLVAAGRLELPALVRDLPEEAGVLDGQGGLGGERLQDVHDFRRELAGRLPVEGQAADDLVLAERGTGAAPGTRTG